MSTVSALGAFVVKFASPFDLSLPYVSLSLVRHILNPHVSILPLDCAPPRTHSVGSTLIGRPTIPTIAVRARVEEHTDAAKVLVFKKKRRTVRFPIFAPIQTRIQITHTMRL